MVILDNLLFVFLIIVINLCLNLIKSLLVGGQSGQSVLIIVICYAIVDDLSTQRLEPFRINSF